MTGRIGFACKYHHPDRSLSKKLLEQIASVKRTQYHYHVVKQTDSRCCRAKALGNYGT